MGLVNPRRLFTALATAEAITWTLLIVGMILKYVTRTTELGVRLGGGLHGFVFLMFALTVVVIGVDRRWAPRHVLLGLASTVVPWATLWFERHVERHHLVTDRWRLADEPARTLPERLVAWAVRRPVLAAVVGLAALAVVFAVLLVLGPPLPSRG